MRVKKAESGHLVKPHGKNLQHEQELPASADYEVQRKGGVKDKNEAGAKPKPGSPQKS
jgi:hypothetical protein